MHLQLLYLQQLQQQQNNNNQIQKVTQQQLIQRELQHVAQAQALQDQQYVLIQKVTTQHAQAVSQINDQLQQTLFQLHNIAPQLKALQTEIQIPFNGVNATYDRTIAGQRLEADYLLLSNQYEQYFQQYQVYIQQLQQIQVQAAAAQQQTQIIAQEKAKSYLLYQQLQQSLLQLQYNGNNINNNNDNNNIQRPYNDDEDQEISISLVDAPEFIPSPSENNNNIHSLNDGHMNIKIDNDLASKLEKDKASNLRPTAPEFQPNSNASFFSSPRFGCGSILETIPEPQFEEKKYELL